MTVKHPKTETSGLLLDATALDVTGTVPPDAGSAGTTETALEPATAYGHCSGAYQFELAGGFIASSCDVFAGKVLQSTLTTGSPSEPTGSGVGWPVAASLGPNESREHENCEPENC